MALVAQGFGSLRPSAVGTRQLLASVERIGLLQIDSVNVLSRAHYLPLFSRLGAYDRALLDRASGQAPRRLVEYWAHEASLIPATTYRYLGFRRRRWKQEAWGGMRRVAVEHAPLVRAVLDEVRRRGPITAAAVEVALAHDAPRTKDQWGWNWSLVKQAIEHLFWTGQVLSAGRTTAFERRYAVPERVLPSQVLELPEPSDEESFAALMGIAARAHGVGTERDLRDYFRLRPADSRLGLQALLDTGEVTPVTVQGIAQPCYLHRAARVPRQVEARALLAPFDPLVWERTRIEQLFGFRYRIEIYTPVERRVHGYYVLPFLLGSDLVARVDLKADRARGTLVVQSAYAEPAAPAHTAAELAAELTAMAAWLGLDAVSVTGRGDLGPQLAVAIGSPSRAQYS